MKEEALQNYSEIIHIFFHKYSNLDICFEMACHINSNQKANIDRIKIIWITHITHILF